MRPPRPAGIKVRLKRLGQAAGVDHVYAHRWRHSFVHEWKLLGGNEGDLMLLMGWSSDEMPHRYRLSAAAERAQDLQLRFGIVGVSDVRWRTTRSDVGLVADAVVVASVRSRTRRAG